MDIFLSSIKSAVSTQSGTQLSQLILIKSAVSTQSGTQLSQLTLIKTAVSTQSGTQLSQLIVIKTAVSTQSGTQLSQLILIKTAVSTQSGTQLSQLKLIKTAVSTQSGTQLSQLKLIKTAVSTQSGTQLSLLILIKSAVSTQSGTQLSQLILRTLITSFHPFNDVKNSDFLCTWACRSSAAPVSLLRKREFNPRPVTMGFVVDKVALEQTFVLVLHVSSVSIILPAFHTHIFEVTNPCCVLSSSILITLRLQIPVVCYQVPYS